MRRQDYQMAVWEDLRREVEEEDPDPKKFELFTKPEEPGYYNPRDYVDRTASWLQRWGILPEPGGLNNQPLNWVRDMELRFAMKARVSKEYYKAKQPGDSFS